jgi:hypothetical protein
MEKEEPEYIKTFRKWLMDNGAYINPSIYFAHGEHGMSIYSDEDLGDDSTVVSCPFDLMITPKSAKESLRKLAEWKGVRLQKMSTIEGLENGLAICIYLVLHLCIQDDMKQDDKGKEIVSDHTLAVLSLIS